MLPELREPSWDCVWSVVDCMSRIRAVETIARANNLNENCVTHLSMLVVVGSKAFGLYVVI